MNISWTRTLLNKTLIKRFEQKFTMFDEYFDVFNIAGAFKINDFPIFSMEAVELLNKADEKAWAFCVGRNT